jgi:hypothetical protein
MCSYVLLLTQLFYGVDKNPIIEFNTNMNWILDSIVAVFVV